jgi:uncharacterized membrane protein
MGLPLLSLVFSSVVSLGLVALKVFWTHRWSHLYLIWNLFLAWLPLIFSLAACELHRRGAARTWRFYGAAFAWLIFFPNAPYILTDLIHLGARHQPHYWVDMILILSFAWTGFLLGFISLFLMHSVVAWRLGKAVGWVFIVVMAGLGGLGVYMGRFLRWNSWDIFINPLGIARDLGRLALDPFGHRNSVMLAVLFGTFMLTAYLMLHALTHLRTLREMPADEPQAEPVPHP